MIVNIQNHGEIFGTLLDISWQVRVTGEIPSGTAFFPRRKDPASILFLLVALMALHQFLCRRTKCHIAPG